MKGSLLLIATLTLALCAFGQKTGGGTTGTSGSTTTGAGTATAPSNNTAGSQAIAPGMNGAVSNGMQGTTTNGTGTATAPSDNTAGVQPVAPGMNGGTGTAPGSVNTTAGSPLVTNGGFVTNGAPASPPILVAPIVHLGTTTPGVGATNSTAGMPVGATSNPGATLGTPSQVPIVPEISAGPAGQSAVSQGFVAIGPPVVNRGVASFDSVYDNQGVYAEYNQQSGKSLAEIAAEARTHSNAQAAHVYTNADVDRMNQQTGGITGAATNAGNTTTAPMGTTPNGVAQPSGVAQPQTPGVITTTPKPQNNSIPHEQSEMRYPQTTEMAQATPPANPAMATPSGSANTAAQRGVSGSAANNQQAGGTNAPSTLPHSASPLPLIAVIGFFAAAGGMFIRH